MTIDFLFMLEKTLHQNFLLSHRQFTHVLPEKDLEKRVNWRCPVNSLVFPLLGDALVTSTIHRLRGNCTVRWANILANI